MTNITTMDTKTDNFDDIPKRIPADESATVEDTELYREYQAQIVGLNKKSDREIQEIAMLCSQ